MKKNRARLIVLLMLALFLVSAPAACGFGDDTTTTSGEPGTTAPATEVDAAIAAVIKSTNIDTPPTLVAGVLLAGSDVAFPPMEFSVEDDVYVGFDIDLCTALAKKMGLELEIVPTAWDGIISALDDGSFDIIMSAMTITPERQARVDFTDAYLPTILAISTPTAAPIGDKAGLATKIVGVQIDTVGESEIEIAGAQEIKRYATLLEAFEDMAAGELDAVVSDKPVNAYILENDPDLKGRFLNTGKIDTGTGYGYAVKKGNAVLLAALNAALQELRAEGVYQRICDKWGLQCNQ